MVLLLLAIATLTSIFLIVSSDLVRKFVARSNRIVSLAVFLIAFNAVGLGAWFAVQKVGERTTTNVTPENIESHLETWFKSAGILAQKMPDEGIAHFDYRLACPNYRTMHVRRRSDRYQQYLDFYTGIGLQPDEQAMLDRLSETKKDEFSRNVTNVIATGKMSCSFGPPFDRTILNKLIPIDGLTELKLMEAYSNLYADLHLLINVIHEQLVDLSASHD